MDKKNTYIEGDELAEDFENNPENWIRTPIAAQNKLRRALKHNKEARVTLRMTQEVLDKIKEKAKNEGLPYQTYINSTLYKIATTKEWQVKIEENLFTLKEKISALEAELKKKAG